MIIIAVPILAAGIGGLTLGAGILDEKKVKSVFGAVLRGGAIAGLSYLILFVSLFVGFSFISGEISRNIDLLTTVFLYGLFAVG